MSERKSHKLTVVGGDPLMGVVRTAIMGGTGLDTKQLGKKPLIAVANSHSELTTGHSHLAALGQKVKDGIVAAGGIAMSSTSRRRATASRWATKACATCWRSAI